MAFRNFGAPINKEEKQLKHVFSGGGSVFVHPGPSLRPEKPAADLQQFD